VGKTIGLKQFREQFESEKYLTATVNGPMANTDILTVWLFIVSETVQSMVVAVMVGYFKFSGYSSFV